MRRKKGQFYIISAIFVVISLYFLSYSLFYDNAATSNDSPILELYKIKEIVNNVDLVLEENADNKTILQLDNYLEFMRSNYNVKLIEFGYFYNSTLHAYNITLKIKGKYNSIEKNYIIPS